MGYWISSQVVKEKGLKPIPWKGLFGSGGPQKEKLQASWNMDKKTYEANKRVLSGNHGFGSKMEYRDMNLYERQIVSGQTLPGYTNLSK